ncbi:HLH-domain-containing protein [Rozella allomycis CSF55]|uniref:HLH-domain-containing protein n=1 Tax=Rozella allomycis (strain CSF55) TaxID=988480 RepID=A0A075AR45_ROZAC|nr:hypothetical protein O9G_000783 [Rozella allomycis CSF55]RKP21979.1 HLH-domain-containing protein [Rozella allomycis CSF55]|eukprot:EPZ32708.1 hypothetical protein O9G_000783 [Rozella allomycis CSF55]
MNDAIPTRTLRLPSISDLTAAVALMDQANQNTIKIGARDSFDNATILASPTTDDTGSEQPSPLPSFSCNTEKPGLMFLPRPNTLLSPSSNRRHSIAVGANISDIDNSDVKRLQHTMSERRRRESIKDGFGELRNCIPGMVSERHSKGEIIRNAIDYIRELEMDINTLKSQIDMLRKETIILDKTAEIDSMKSNHNHHVEELLYPSDRHRLSLNSLMGQDFSAPARNNFDQ